MSNTVVDKERIKLKPTSLLIDWSNQKDGVLIKNWYISSVIGNIRYYYNCDLWLKDGKICIKINNIYKKEVINYFL